MIGHLLVDFIGAVRSGLLLLKKIRIHLFVTRHPSLVTFSDSTLQRLKLARCPHSRAATLAALSSMSLIPFTPFNVSTWRQPDMCLRSPYMKRAASARQTWRSE